ncbi:signal peptidase I [Actinoplanes sp. NPDC049548]|uniref:signal peptidase I n=1 Tax=Actinoplanes sp. NPDC049548 TaxID=3155152 RepID=UPI00343AA0A2
MGRAQLTRRTESRRPNPARLISYASLGLFTLAASLVLSSLAPLAVGWKPSVVLTGSMQPTIAPGDVVIAEPVGPAALGPGRVIRFEDPTRPGHYLVHRIVDINPDGTYVTKGDANSVNDPRPVPAAAITGALRLRVPWVGLPRTWAANGDYGPLLMLAGAFPLVWSLRWLGEREPPARRHRRTRKGIHR